MLLRTIITFLCAFYTGSLFASIDSVNQPLSVKDFLDEPHVYDAEFSPDGRYLALIIKAGKTRTVVVRDFATEGRPITGTMSHQFVRASSITWVNDTRLVVNLLIPNVKTSKLKRDAESKSDFDLNNYRMSYRSVSVGVNCKDPVILVNSNAYSKRNRNLSRISNYLPNDPDHIIMPAWGYRGLQLLKVNIYNGEARELVKGGRRTYRFLTDINGTPTYRLDYFYYGKSIRVYQYNSDEKDWEKIDTINLNQSDDESLNNDGLIRFGFGDNYELIYRERNEQTGYYEIVRRSRVNDERKVIASLKNKDIHSPIFDSRTNKYIGYRVQDDLIRNHYVDDDVQSHYDKIAKSVGHSNFYIWSSRAPKERTVVLAYGSDNPGTFFSYNYSEKKTEFLADKYKKIIPENLGIPGYVSYTTRDGVTVRMYVVFPPGYKEGTPVPMVVLPHGGPHIRDSATYDEFAQFISTRGYLVIKPNFRGSSGFGFEFEEAGYKQWGRIMQDDLTDAVRFMVKQGYSDPNSICIVGGSYGGYAALMGAVKTPDLYQCSVSINGVSHLKDQIEHDIDSARSGEEKIEDYVYKTIGHPKDDSVMLDKNSPSLNADKIKIPILIIAGEKDKVVPVDQSEMMVEALEDNNKRHLYFELEDTGHNVFYYKEDIKKVYTEVEKFLATYIGNNETIANPRTEKAPSD